jgi:2-oxoglutarate dehydrogenase E1 component
MTKDFGVNAGLVSELLGMYLHDRNSVDEQWRAYLDALIGGGDPGAPQLRRDGGNGSSTAVRTRAYETIAPGTAAAPMSSRSPASMQDATLTAGVTQLIAAYRARGHLLAQIDPLGLLMQTAPPALVDFQLKTFGLSEADLDTEFPTVDIPGLPTATLREIVARMQATYCGSIGVEFRDIEEPEQRYWLQERMEATSNRVELTPELSRRILGKLTDAETLETFIHKNFLGAKRFSLQGGESLIPMLDLLLDKASEYGAEEVVMGMAHRGRLNVLVNIMEKNVSEIFAAFADTEPERHLGSGDVKYHLGASTDRIGSSGKRMHLTLAFNPSHLEWVNPVVEGRVRSKQDRKGDKQRRQVVPLLIHGDAAFIGQGVNAETLNMARLDGYCTGGTVHVIVNNQVGFTTIPRDARSTRYATDLARMLRVPCFHVNGEDLEAVAWVAQLAVEYRQKFGADVVVDLYCYRRYGHNEGDEPRYTQPVMYAAIDQKPTIREIFARAMVDTGKISQDEIDQVQAESHKELTDALEHTRRSEVSWVPHAMGGVWIPYRGGKDKSCPEVATKVDGQKLIDLARKLGTTPQGFHAHPKVAEILRKRVEKVESNDWFDWGTGEALAFASLLDEGTNIRLSGQDARRGTFSHRHSVLFDGKTGESYTPLCHLGESQGDYEVWDSPLSEAGVLGFDYGYSLDHPDALVLWEAQFGDFANGAQVIIDQFISSAEDKWRRLSGITLLLPHGYEGQGPEHSNARFSRFLTLCAEDNIQVCNLTTPAQLFHALRRQVKRAWRKPLVIMTPKSLLRLPSKPNVLLHACSTLKDLTDGKFQRVIPDAVVDPKKARKVIACTGKVYYDLTAAREERGITDVAIIRVEQMYPLNDELIAAFAPYKEGTPLVWVQEEPWNMGGWFFVNAHFPLLIGDRLPLSCVAREESASPATGSMASHKLEQARLMDQAMA